MEIQPMFLVNEIFPAYYAGQEGFSTENLPNLAYVLDGQGWKIWKRNGVSTALIPVEAVSGVAALGTAIEFKAVKLPLELIRKVTAWFKAVYQKYQSEAVGYLFYRDGEWEFVPPAQTAEEAHARYDRVPKRDGWQTAGTIHSHGYMSAFHSGTDDADEKFFDGVHITVGKVDSVPEYSCSIVVQGQREVVDPSVLIDGMAPVDAIPVEWLSAMKLTAPRGLEEPFQAQATGLHKRYFAGELAELAYMVELGKIKIKSETAREQKFAPNAHSKKTGGKVGRTTLPVSRQKKGGIHDDYPYDEQ